MAFIPSLAKPRLCPRPIGGRCGPRGWGSRGAARIHRLAQPLRLPTRDATSPEQQRPPVCPSSAPVPTSFVISRSAGEME